MKTATKIIKQNSTHQAILNGDKIEIWEKGLEYEDLKFEPVHLYNIPAENQDDLLPIFELFEEEIRCLTAEFKAEIS